MYDWHWHVFFCFFFQDEPRRSTLTASRTSKWRIPTQNASATRNVGQFSLLFQQFVGDDSNGSFKFRPKTVQRIEFSFELIRESVRGTRGKRVSRTKNRRRIYNWFFFHNYAKPCLHSDATPHDYVDFIIIVRANTPTVSSSQNPFINTSIDAFVD